MNLDTVGTVGAVGALGERDGKLQSLEDVVLQVLSILDTAAQPDQIVKDTDSLTLITGNTGVGHATGDLAQTLNSSQRLGEGEDLGDLAESLGGSVATADAEGQHTTAHAVAVLLEGNCAVRVGVKAGVVDGNDVRGSLERVGNGGGVLGGLASTEVQRLETTVSQP